MTEFTPILQSRPGRGVERLLGSARIDVPRPGGVARTVAALGLVSGVTATAGASAAAATSSGAAVIVKWLVVGAVAGAAMTGTGEAVRYSIDANREARPAVHQTAAAPAAPARVAAASPRAALPDVPAAREEVPAPVTAPDSRGAQAVLKAPVASQPTLSEEVRALDAVRQLMAAGDARSALRALDDFSRRFPQPRLGPEAALLREQARRLIEKP